MELHVKDVIERTDRPGKWVVVLIPKPDEEVLVMPHDDYGEPEVIHPNQVKSVLESFITELRKLKDDAELQAILERAKSLADKRPRRQRKKSTEKQEELTI